MVNVLRVNLLTSVNGAFYTNASIIYFAYIRTLTAVEKKDAYTFTSGDAENYDYYLGPILFEPYGQYLATQIEAGLLTSVLELASGTGRVTKHIRQALPQNVALYATDISTDMLDIARHKLHGADITFAVENIQWLSFADNSFDLVICQFGLMFLPDKQKGFAEILRVLKPGGRFMFFTWDKTENIPLFKLIINDTILPHFPDQDNTRFFVPFSLHNPLQLKKWMKVAGFTDVECRQVSLPSGNASPENIVDAFFRKHTLGRELKTKAPEAFEPISQILLQHFSSLAKEGGVSLPLSAFLTSCTK